MSKSKKVKITERKYNKVTNKSYNSTDSEKVIWVFSETDKNGDFPFTLGRIDNYEKLSLVFDKMIQYENMTWAEVKQQTHDSSKSKHHFLDYEGMSDSAQKRITELHLEDDLDSIFSFALTNKLRIIGIRRNEKFYVKWYDPEHKFYPAQK